MQRTSRQFLHWWLQDFHRIPQSMKINRVIAYKVEVEGSIKGGKIYAKPCILFDSEKWEYNQLLKHCQTSYAMLDSLDGLEDQFVAFQSHPKILALIISHIPFICQRTEQVYPKNLLQFQPLGWELKLNQYKWDLLLQICTSDLQLWSNY